MANQLEHPHNTYEGIDLFYEEKWAHITVDTSLVRYLGKSLSKNALKLSEHIQKEYFKIYNKKLDIELHSMEMEILIHVYVDIFARILDEMSGTLLVHIKTQLNQLVKRIMKKTATIDCGEISVDKNRHIFDTLSRFRPKIIELLMKYRTVPQK